MGHGFDLQIIHLRLAVAEFRQSTNPVATATNAT